MGESISLKLLILVFVLENMGTHGAEDADNKGDNFEVLYFKYLMSLFYSRYSVERHYGTELNLFTQRLDSLLQVIKEEVN